MKALQYFVTFGSEVRWKHRNNQVDVALEYSIRRTVVVLPCYIQYTIPKLLRELYYCQVPSFLYHFQ
jgi:hypothetical protein